MVGAVPVAAPMSAPASACTVRAGAVLDVWESDACESLATQTWGGRPVRCDWGLSNGSEASAHADASTAVAVRVTLLDDRYEGYARARDARVLLERASTAHAPAASSPTEAIAGASVPVLVSDAERAAAAAEALRCYRAGAGMYVWGGAVPRNERVGGEFSGVGIDDGEDGVAVGECGGGGGGGGAGGGTGSGAHTSTQAGASTGDERLTRDRCGWDCSGLVQWCYMRAPRALPVARDAWMQERCCEPLLTPTYKHCVAGDLLFFGGKGPHGAQRRAQAFAHQCERMLTCLSASPWPFRAALTAFPLRLPRAGTCARASAGSGVRGERATHVGVVVSPPCRDSWPPHLLTEDAARVSGAAAIWFVHASGYDEGHGRTELDVLVVEDEGADGRGASVSGVGLVAAAYARQFRCAATLVRGVRNTDDWFE